MLLLLVSVSFVVGKQKTKYLLIAVAQSLGQ